MLFNVGGCQRADVDGRLIYIVSSRFEAVTTISSMTRDGLAAWTGIPAVTLRAVDARRVFVNRLIDGRMESPLVVGCFISVV